MIGWSRSKHLNTMGVPEEFKIEFAANKFEGCANIWWRQVKRMCDINNMSREQFDALFNEKYFQESYRDEKVMEFINL